MLRQTLVRRLSSGQPLGGVAFFRRLGWPARIGFVFFLFLGLIAFAPELFAPYSPTKHFVGPSAHAPTWSHLFGTDQFGRDVLSRVIYGARVSVSVGLVAAASAFVAGSMLGAIAASSRRIVGESIMRVLDVVMAFPVVILAVVLATVLRPSLRSTMIVLAIVYTPAMARVVRANVLVQYSEDYVTAEQLIGASRPRILMRHVAINVLAPVIVFMTVVVADAMFVETALSFLSVGVQPPTPSWGNIMADGRQLIDSGGWWVTAFGGCAIFLAILSLNVLADGLADAIGAPRPTAKLAGVGEAVADGETPRRRRLRRARADAVDAVAFTPSVLPRRGGEALLRVEDLSVSFPSAYGPAPIVSHVSFEIGRNETVGLVGESGSGKSLTSLAIMGLLPRSAVVRGAILYRDRELLSLPTRERRRLLGPELAMVYQDALSSLNPSMKVQAQLKQVCRRGSRFTPEELLELVHLPARGTLASYPHQLSGGQRQRVLLAIALSREPSLLIADEPTTALDETVQAQIVDLLQGLRVELGMSMLLISHDLALVTELADIVVVMYAGQVAEIGTSADLVAAPRHPYTHGLLDSILSLEAHAPTLASIPGTVPPPTAFGVGCRFAGRCRNEGAGCALVPPVLEHVGDGHWLACHYPDPVREQAASRVPT